MKLYSKNEHYKLYKGNMLDLLQVIEPCSIDSIITDPPYGLTSIVKRYGKPEAYSASKKLAKGFMGKEWDGSGIEYNVEAWAKCYEVLKPGGYLLAFGGSRTFYRIACAIEDAGFEVRDTIMWLYGSGFPKSLNIGLALDKKNGVESEVNGAQNEWSGWGTALKPAFEPIIVARKPFKGSLIDNVLEYGVGGLNIDECRVPTDGELVDNHKTVGAPFMRNADEYLELDRSKSAVGRFPANVILTYGENDAEEALSGFPTGGKNGSISKRYKMNNQVYGEYGYCNTFDAYEDSGSAARYFYCAKASRKDRDEGLDEMPNTYRALSNQAQAALKRENKEYAAQDHSGFNKVYVGKNTHPTVKPTELMQYLIRLATPKGGTILDPFNGSGSTGKAAMYENKERGAKYKYIGIDLSDEYLNISRARIEFVCGAENGSVAEPAADYEGQLNIFQFIKGDKDDGRDKDKAT